MAKKKSEDIPPAGAPAWMATFSDLMNLLMCFFVLLFSMSSVDPVKYEQAFSSLANNAFSIFDDATGSGIGEGQLISSGASQLTDLGEYFNDVGKASNEDVPPDSDIVKEYEKEKQEKKEQAAKEIYEDVVNMTEQSKVDEYVTVELDKNYNYIHIDLNGAVLFRSGNADIIEDAVPILDKVGNILKYYKEFTIEVEGHTDNVPIHNSKFESNTYLSSARASVVADYLMDEKGLRDVKASGCGDKKPIGDNKTPEGRAKNRRVEIKIYNKYN